MDVDVPPGSGHPDDGHGEARRHRVTRVVGAATRWTVAGSLAATGALVALAAHDAPGSSSPRSGAAGSAAVGGASPGTTSPSAASGLAPPPASPTPAQGLPRLSTGQS